MLANIYISSLQFVNEIKDANTNKAFRIFYFIIQIYINFNRNFILI